MKLLIPLATIAVSVTLGSAVAVAVVKETDGSAAPATTVVREAAGTPAVSTTGAESIGDIYRSNVTGVVEIKVQTTTTSSAGPFGPTQQAEVAQGTGFEIDSKGDIVTNAHVVAGARSINVTTDDGHSYTATLVGSDPSSDVAVIHINASGSALHPLTFADSSGVQVGDEVVAIGDPFGLTDTVTAGIVSALNRTITSPNNTPITNAIQTDAAINHGNSGGPLLNAAGQVVGITSQIYADSNTSGNVGIGFVVPSDTVRSVASQLLATGKVSRPFVGVYLADVDQADGAGDRPAGGRRDHQGDRRIARLAGRPQGRHRPDDRPGTGLPDRRRRHHQGGRLDRHVGRRRHQRRPGAQAR